MKIIYICSPYHAGSEKILKRNIEYAKELTREILLRGDARNYGSFIYDAVLVRRKRKRKKYRIDSRNGHIEKMRRNHCRRKIRNFGGNVKGDSMCKRQQYDNRIQRLRAKKKDIRCEQMSGASRVRLEIH